MFSSTIMYPIRPNSLDSSGQTALMLTCAGGHTEGIRLLLEKGAHLEDSDSQGYTALSHAAASGHASSVEMLINCGANSGQCSCVTSLVYPFAPHSIFLQWAMDLVVFLWPPPALQNWWG